MRATIPTLTHKIAKFKDRRTPHAYFREGLAAIPETEGVRASERKVREKSEWGEDDTDETARTRGTEKHEA